MSTLEPPFLKLDYYVGIEHIGDAARRILSLAKASAGVAEFERLLAQNTVGDVPTRISVPNVVGICGNEELSLRHGVIVLRSAGKLFCEPMLSRPSRKRVATGLKLYRRFLDIATLVDCAYGAILVEYSLEEPEQLKKSHSLTFRDFFVSRKKLGDKTLSAIRQIVGSNSYVEELDAGIFVSMNPWFNPDHVSVGAPDAGRRSAQVGKAVARVLGAA